MTSGSSSARGALDGVKILDLTRFGAGPICTQLLGDMGAEVIKVEEASGDPARFSAPAKGDTGGYFPLLNRNKKSVTLDLRKPEGKELLRKLILWADMLAENFRPGTMARLGFPYDKVHEINPRLVMVSITGFGQTGPYAERAAFDGVGQAMGGLMSITGYADRPPARTGALAGDMTGGMMGTIGALLALYHQEATGQGQHVDASIFDGLLELMGVRIMTEVRGVPCGRGESQGAAPVDTVLTRDGKYVVVMAQNDNHWQIVARLMGKAGMIDDPRYKTRAERGKRAAEVNAWLRDWAATLTSQELQQALDKEGIAYGPVQTISDLVVDEHARQRGAIVDVDHWGEVLPLVGVLPKLSETPGGIRTLAPHIGQHNEEVYRSVLGVSAAEFEELKQKKVI
ncbi:MAG: CoA transferase [Chloroflexi bacterium]|nr:CoA transferase [Chloroflexota bacterium]